MQTKILAALIYAYLWVVYRTSRWEMQGYDVVLNNANQQKKQIFLFWHGRISMMSFFKPKNQDTYLISSRHRDGQLMAGLMRHFGIKMIYGSSRRAGSSKDRGGREALVQAMRKLKENAALALTPDGPRGPRMRVGGHVVDIAKRTGAEIIPMSFSSTHGKLFDSWDRFFLPLPFGKMIYLAGNPITIVPDADSEMVEKTRKKIEDDLNALTRQADSIAKRKETPEPAPIV